MNMECYLGLFEHYGLARSDFYLAEVNDADVNLRIFELFDEITTLLESDSPLNRKIPREFSLSAQGYGRKDPHTISHFDNTEHRAFFLSDLYDYLMLMQLRRKA